MTLEEQYVKMLHAMIEKYPWLPEISVRFADEMTKVDGQSVQVQLAKAFIRGAMIVEYADQMIQQVAPDSPRQAGEIITHKPPTKENP